MPPTMNDVAARANVSQATVSRVFRRNKNTPIGTYAKVIEAAEALGYKPRQGITPAKGTTTIVLAFTHSYRMHITKSPSVVDVIHGIEMEATRRHVFLAVRSLFTNGGSADTQRLEIPRELEEGFAHGAIIMGSASEEFFKKLQRANQPYVGIEVGLGLPQGHIIMPDHYACGYLAAQHLLELGHRRIVYAGSPAEFYCIRQQTSGYRDALWAAGIAEEKHIIIRTTEEDFENLQVGQKVAERVLSMQERPTAIIFGGEVDTEQALKVFLERGLKVPEDLSLVSSGSTRGAICRSTQPTLTNTCCISDEKLGEAAVARLIQVMQDKQHPQRIEIFPTKLVRGGSTAPPREEARA
jgi:LacI family transcriptional regulator